VDDPEVRRSAADAIVHRENAEGVRGRVARSARGNDPVVGHDASGLRSSQYQIVERVQQSVADETAEEEREQRVVILMPNVVRVTRTLL